MSAVAERRKWRLIGRLIPAPPRRLSVLLIVSAIYCCHHFQASGSASTPRHASSLSRAWSTLLAALADDEPLHRCLSLRALDGALESLHGALAGRGGVRRRIAAALAEMVAADELEHNRREAAVLLGKMAALLAAEGGGGSGGAAASATAGPASAPSASASSSAGEGAWTAALAYPALKRFLAQSLPSAHARLLGETPSPYAPVGHAPRGSQGGGSHGAPQKAASLGGKASTTVAPKSSRDTSSSIAGPAAAAAATSAAAPAFSPPAENTPAAQTGTLVAALEAFGYLLDSAPACAPLEAQRADDLLAALLGAVESSAAVAAAVPSGGALCADVFVRAQALCVLAQQLRFTHRNRRRIARFIPALKRLMASAGGGATSVAGSAAAISTAASPAASAPSSSPALIAGATSHNIPGGSELLHPALLRSLGRVVSTWYCLPPDRILRRFPAPAMLRGYAAREWAKLHVGSGYDGRRGESGGGQQHRRNASSSTSLLSLIHQRPLSSSPSAVGAAEARTSAQRPSHRSGASITAGTDVLDSSVYSLQDSDELGWASTRGVDALLGDMAKWASRRSLAEVDAHAATLVSGRPSSNSKGASSVSKAPPPPPQQQHGNRPTLSLSGGGDGDDLVNELLSQWQDVTFGLRGDMTVGPPPPTQASATATGTASTTLQPSKAAKSKSRTSAQLKPRANGAKGSTKASSAAQSRSSSSATAASASAASRCYTVEFSPQTCVRVLQLHNRSAQHAHDFFLQVYPGWLWRAEPAWGTLEPRSSRPIKLVYTPSPLDVAGTRSAGFVRVRSAQGFALERIELVGFSGPTLRVLNAAGNAGTPLHFAAAASSQRSSTATSRPPVSASQSLSLTSKSKGGSIGSNGATSSTPFEPSDLCEPTIDFGVCVVGVARSVDLYVQNIGPVSTQATVAYLPGTEARSGSAAAATTGAAAKSKDGSSSSQPLPAFSVIPSLLFLRPHQTACVRVMFYPAAAGPSPPSARLAVMGPGEECYSFSLRGRGGAPLRISPAQGLDFGPVDMWRGTGGAREIVAELMARGVEPAELGESLASLAAAVTAATAAAAATNSAHHHRRLSSLSAAFSSPPSFAAAPAAPRPGVHVQWLSLTNHNEDASLAVSFRYSGQRDESEGRDRDRERLRVASSAEDDDSAHDSAAAGSAAAADLSQFCPLYVRDTVIPAGGTVRVAVVFLAQSEGSFSRRLFINTPATPTDSLSVLVSAHVGPFLRVGRSGVLNLPPVSTNTAAHHVLPLRNLANCTVDVEVHGLDRTPVYWVLARVPLPRAQPKALEQSRTRGDKKKLDTASAAGKAGSSFAGLISVSSNAAASAAAALHLDELNEQFDPANSLSALDGSFGRDFLPQPLPLADCSTAVLASLASTPQRVTLRPLETVLLHLWFVSPVPGFYSIPFSVRAVVGAAPGRAPVHQQYGPVEIKAVCLARSGLQAVAPQSDAQEHTEGAAAAAAAASAALEAEDPDSAALLRSSTDALLSGAVQYRADASSLSLHPLRKFSSLPSNRALHASPAGGAQGGGPSRSYLSEFVSVPSERFDAEVRACVLPPNEGGGAQLLLADSLAAADSDESAQLTGKRRASLMAGDAASGPDYLLCRLPNGVHFGSTLLRLPPRLWLWRRKTMMVLLNNQTAEPQSFFAFLSFPFRSALVDQLDSWAELDTAASSLAEGGRGPSLSSLRARSAAARSDAPNHVAPGQTVKIDLSLPGLEEYAGARAKELARAEARERERERNDAAAANSGNSSGYPGLYGDARNRRGSLRGNSGDLMAAVDESGGDPDSFASDSSFPRHFKSHSLATGYLALVDAQNHLCVCALRGVLGDLVSVETDPRSLVFECTVAQSGSAANGDGDGGEADASSSQRSAAGRPVTLYLKVVNHTDLSIAIGFRLAGATAISASGSTKSATNGFSVGALSPPWLSAYETRLVPVTFSPAQIGRYSADLACWYANPYNPSERFDCFSVRLQGQFVHPGLVEFEQSGSAADEGVSGGALLAAGFASQSIVESSSSSSGVFVDCGTVLAPSADAAASTAASGALVLSTPNGVAAAATDGKGALLTLHNSSDRQLLVSALGCAPFIVSLPDHARDTAAKEATAGHKNDRALISTQTARPVDPPADTVGSLLGDNASARRRNAWAERRAARMRLKSGTSYVLDDGGRGDSNEAASSPPQQQQSGIRSTLQPVSQQLAPLSSVSFRIDFVPASWARGAFAARILLCFSRFWRSVDVFGVAGQLQLSSNFGPPTSTTDIAPGSSDVSGGGASASALPNASVAASNDSTHAHTRFGIGVGTGGGVQKRAGRPGHHREASMPVFSSPALEQIDLFNPAVAMHARRSSLNMGLPGMTPGLFAKSTGGSAASAATAGAAAGAAAAGPTPIDLGLSPLKRLMSRAFHLTNTGSTAMLISRIHISNAQGGVAGGAFAVGSNASLSARQGGMSWSFAHTTIVRDTSGPRSGSDQAKEVRLHTLASGAGNGPALIVHARHALSATALKANALSNVQRKRTSDKSSRRRAATTTADIAAADSVTVAAAAVARNRADGFGAPGLDLDLDAQCIDWDEVDYQLDAAAAAAHGGAQGAGAAASSLAGRGHKGSPSLLAVTPHKVRRGGRRNELSDSDAPSASDGGGDGDDGHTNATDSDEDGDSAAALDFPLVLHPGHSLPLTLSWFKEQPGAYLHEVQISCSDPSLAAAASVAAKAGGAGVQSSSSDKVIVSRNAKPSQSRAVGSKSLSFATALVSKRFDFLFRVSAQEVLRIDPGRSVLDFGIVRLSGQAHHATAPKSLTFSFLNEGPLPLNWRLLKLSVQLSRMRGAAAASTSPARNVSAARRNLLRGPEEGPNGSDSDTDGAASDGDMDSAGVDFVDESAVHETAFALSPSSGTLQPRQRQTVSVHFVPRAPHLRYAWSVRLHTADMMRAADQAAEGAASTSRRGSKATADSTLVRLVGVAGSSMLQLLGVDEATGVQRPLPFASASAFSAAGTGLLASAQELSFGCISVGCERHKRLLLHNPGELATRFELSSPPSMLQRFTLDPPTGFVAPGGTVELRAQFTPNGARSFSSTMLVRWGSALQSQGGGGSALRLPSPADGSVGMSADVELSETPLRLLLTGRGGSSALHVPDLTLDFGTVTVNQDHVRLLRVQNVAGAAEGQILLTIDHPNLRLRQPDAVMFVQPGGVYDVPVSPTCLQQTRRMRSVSCACGAVRRGKHLTRWCGCLICLFVIIFRCCVRSSSIQPASPLCRPPSWSARPTARLPPTRPPPPLPSWPKCRCAAWWACRGLWCGLKGRSTISTSARV